MVPGARRDGAEADTARPEEVGEGEAPIVPGEALVESAPAPVDAPEVGQTGGGMTELSPADAATARSDFGARAASLLCHRRVHSPGSTGDGGGTVGSRWANANGCNG